MNHWIKSQFALACFCPIFLLGSGCQSLSRSPRDADLQRRLVQSRQIFDQLVNMADQDRAVARIAPEFYKLDSNNSAPLFEPTVRFTRNRWDQYRELFLRIDLKNGLMRLPEYPDVIFFLPFENVITPWLEKSYDEGYAYSTASVSPLLDTLEHPNSIRSGFAFKRVTGGWSLFINKAD